MQYEADRIRPASQQVAVQRAREHLASLDSKLASRRAVQQQLADYQDDPVYVFASESVQSLLTAQAVAQQDLAHCLQLGPAEQQHLQSYHRAVIDFLRNTPIPD